MLHRQIEQALDHFQSERQADNNPDDLRPGSHYHGKKVIRLDTDAGSVTKEHGPIASASAIWKSLSLPLRVMATQHLRTPAKYFVSDRVRSAGVPFLVPASVPRPSVAILHASQAGGRNGCHPGFPPLPAVQRG